MAHSYQQGRKPLTIEITPFNVRWEELMPELQLEILRFINTAASAPGAATMARQELQSVERLLESHIRASEQIDEEERE
jgi:hypothetical protein